MINQDKWAELERELIGFNRKSWEERRLRQHRENLLKWGLLFMAVAIVVMLVLVASSHGAELSSQTLYIGTQPDPADRLKIQVTDEEYRKLPKRGHKGQAWITDVTGKHYHLKRVSCGLPHDMCALALIEVGK